MNRTTTDLTWIAAAFALALAFPLVLIAILPVTLGIPHVLGDVRHLVLRRGLLQRPRVLLFAGLPVLAAGLGAGPLAAAPATCGAAIAANTTPRKRMLAIVLSLLFGLSIWQLGILAPLIFVQTHNLVGIAIWYFWKPEQCRDKMPALILMLAATAVIFSPLTGPALNRALAATAFQGRTLHHLLPSFAPGLDASLGARLVIFFCFAQMLHYLVWLKFLPDAEGTKTRQSLRQRFADFAGDFGRPLWFGVMIAAIAFALWGLPQAWFARDTYLRVAAFHGYIEFAALSLFLLEGGPKNP